MTKHTIGPWTWSSDGTTLRGSDDVVLAIDLPEFIEDADKALIAAAPDLLDEAANALAFLDTIEWNNDQSERDAEDIKLALTLAIDKAEGY